MNHLFKFTPAFLLALVCLLVQCKSDNSTPVAPKSSAKSLDTPAVDSVNGATSTFDATTNSYTLTVPGGTDLTAIKFTFSLPAGATAKPASGSTLDFTNPVTYTVTAEDGSTQTFTVKAVYRTTWASSQDRYDAIRLKAQRVSGATVSAGIPSTYFVNLTSVTDADAAYLINTAEFGKTYSDTKATVWSTVDKTKLEYYSIQLTIATGELRVDKGVSVTLRSDGSLYSYKQGWILFYSK